MFFLDGVSLFFICTILGCINYRYRGIHDTIKKILIRSHISCLVVIYFFSGSSDFQVSSDYSCDVFFLLLNIFQNFTFKENKSEAKPAQREIQQLIKQKKKKKTQITHLGTAMVVRWVTIFGFVVRS